MPRLFSAVFLAVLLAACSGTPAQEPLAAGECADNSYCEGMQACIGGSCKEVRCLTNVDCPLGQFCDEEAAYTCNEGCAEDSDCLSGQTCNGGSCEQAACVDVDVDCGIGEHCISGACVPVEGFCDQCDEANPCDEGMTCTWFNKEKVSACLPDCVPSPDDADDCPSRTVCYGEGNNSTGVCSAGCPDLWAVGAF